jgi:hypothetical protein
VIIKRAVKAGVAAFLALVALPACGGKVVISEQELGQGGEGGGSGSTSGSTGQSQDCPWADPVGQVVFCGSAAAGGNQCSTAYCDEQNNVYEADCSATACQCKHNTVVKCTCALNEPGNICDGTSPPCCSAPIQ